MTWLSAAIVFTVPLAVAPRLFFYYDVTPKSAALMAGTAMLLLWTAWKPQTSLSFMTSRFGRWNAVLTAGLVLFTVLAALDSPVLSLPGGKALVWFGSNWRSWGAVEQIATVVCAFLLAAWAGRSFSRLLVVLRALCAAGVLAAFYGIAQYLGFDPLIPASTYVVGEGPYQIVRPPGPLGHSDYFAAFLLWPIFAGAALVNQRKRRADQWLGGVAVCSGGVAVILSGSRGAFLGLVVGAAVLIFLIRPRARTIASASAAFAAIAFVFYLSPAGARLRARAFWISEDRAGGARLLLWRDSLRMSAAHPSTGLGSGLGPEAFVAEFPHFQSAELARAYPDFYHESPHNIFLDALSGLGLAGVLLLAGWIGLGTVAGLRSPPGARAVAGALLAGLAASVVAQQFVVFIVPTAFAFYLAIGLLTGLETGGASSVAMPLRLVIACSSLAAAAFLGVCTYRMVEADVTLARVRNLLDSGNRGQAAALWESARSSGSAKRARSYNVTADLYFSRRWAAAASATQDPLEKIRLSALAIDAARLATTVPEQQQNAWYNLAMLAAAVDEPRAVESALRSAISAGPQWFKPHWALARLLYADGRTDEARQQAALALDLNGHRDAEVIATTNEILRSLDSRR